MSKRHGCELTTARVLSTKALMPKSAILATPLRSIRMLAGLMSLCTCHHPNHILRFLCQIAVSRAASQGVFQNLQSKCHCTSRVSVLRMKLQSIFWVHSAPSASGDARCQAECLNRGLPSQCWLLLRLLPCCLQSQHAGVDHKCWSCSKSHPIVQEATKLFVQQFQLRV